jgi:hypothetical protein
VTLSYLSAEALAPRELLALYLSLPETVGVNELFDGGDAAGVRYEMKGMIGYNGGHYVTWFRTTESD